LAVVLCIRRKLDDPEIASAIAFSPHTKIDTSLVNPRAFLRIFLKDGERDLADG